LSPRPVRVVVAGHARDDQQEADMSGINGIGWFEIGTDDPAGAEKFYGDLFGWTIARDASDGPGYQVFKTGDDGPGLHMGGLADTEGSVPGYAVFGVWVEDVADTCRRVEAAGGRVHVAPRTSPMGITSAHLLDPKGTQFQVYSMPPGRE
jgi:uncharacterized protein